MSGIWQYAVLGLTAGGAYSLIALGIVVTHRGSGILNFAQGAVGMAAAYVYWELRARHGLPQSVAVASAIGAGVLLGVICYLGVVRWLYRASDLARVVASFGLLALLQGIAVKRYGVTPIYLEPLLGSSSVTLFGARAATLSLVVVGVTVVVAIIVALVIDHTRFGLNCVALQENRNAAAAIGISPHWCGTVTWAVGGGVSATAGILLLGVIGLSPNALTLVVIPAMAACLLGRFRSLTITIAAALAIGVAESVLIGQGARASLVKGVPFLVIIVALVVLGLELPGRGSIGETRLPSVGSGRIKPIRTAMWVAFFAVVAATTSGTWAVAVSNGAIAMLFGLSIVVVTGYAGQLSVGTMALAGLSALIAARLSADANLPFLLCASIGTAVAAAAGVIIAVPAVRVRGVNLVIVTLGLSLLVESAVFNERSLTGGFGISVRSPEVFGLSVDPGAHPDRYAIVCLCSAVLFGIAVANVRRGVSGRRYLAVRASERGAAALGISPRAAKLAAFAVASAIAGWGGALTAFRTNIASFEGNYTVSQSIGYLVLTVVGGVGHIGGAIFAGLGQVGGLLSLFTVEVLHFSAIDSWLAILSAVLVLDMMVRFPDGIVAYIEATRRLLQRATRALIHQVDRTRTALPQHVIRRPCEQPAPPARRPDTDTTSPVMSADSITVTYGGVPALRDVSLDLRAGEILAVIGPNGAGKTSLIDALTGFTPIQTGRVTLRGSDITRLPPDRRAGLGLARSFQNLELFDDLTVRENLLAAADDRRTTAYVFDLFHPGRPIPPSVLLAEQLLDLSCDVSHRVRELPQGRRRMVAIARLIVMEPAVICLDEPAAGLGDVERTQLCDVLRWLAATLGAAVLLVEHNIDVVTAVADTVLALDFGQAIAHGPTEQVLRAPAVRDAYLGRSRAGPAVEEGVGTHAH